MGLLADAAVAGVAVVARPALRARVPRARVRAGPAVVAARPARAVDPAPPRGGPGAAGGRLGAPAGAGPARLQLGGRPSPLVGRRRVAAGLPGRARGPAGGQGRRALGVAVAGLPGAHGPAAHAGRGGGGGPAPEAGRGGEHLRAADAGGDRREGRDRHRPGRHPGRRGGGLQRARNALHVPRLRGGRGAAGPGPRLGAARDRRLRRADRRGGERGAGHDRGAPPRARGGPLRRHVLPRPRRVADDAAGPGRLLRRAPPAGAGDHPPPRPARSGARRARGSAAERPAGVRRHNRSDSPRRP